MTFLLTVNFNDDLSVSGGRVPGEKGEKGVLRW